MSRSPSEFLDSCRSEGTAALERLIRKMTEAGCTKVVLTDHPDYGFVLGILNADVDVTALGDDVSLIANFYDRYRQFQGLDEDDSDLYIEDETSWAWIRECWLAAQGPESGKIVVLFKNGEGDMMDLNTGEDPDDDSEIDDLTW